MGETFGFKLIPNGIFVDEKGIIRFQLFGGFSHRKKEILEVIQQLVDGEIKSFDSNIWKEDEADFEQDNSTKNELINTLVQLGQEYLSNDKEKQALKQYERALELDPDNFVIRKQIWLIKYPEKFHPEVDYEWQKKQLAKEKEEESKKRKDELECGPDGCEIDLN